MKCKKCGISMTYFCGEHACKDSWGCPNCVNTVNLDTATYPSDAEQWDKDENEKMWKNEM